MLKASLLVLGVAVGLAGVPAARAQSALGGPDSAWYAGGAVGQSSNALCKQPFGVGVCDDSDTAYRIFAGYQVNRYLALEFGYHQLGDTTLSSAGLTQTVESKAFDLVAVGNLPVAQRFGVYGKLGLHKQWFNNENKIYDADGSGMLIGGDGGAQRTASSDMNGTWSGKMPRRWNDRMRDSR